MTIQHGYTQEQVDILLLKQRTDDIGGTLKEVKSSIQAHFNWTMGSIFGLYAIAMTGLIGTIIKLFWK